MKKLIKKIKLRTLLLLMFFFVVSILFIVKILLPNISKASSYQWKLDEGYGTTTQESVSNADTGTLTGSTLPTWQTDDFCKSGKCLFFSGASKVTLASEVDPKTVEFWIRPTSSFSATQVIISFTTGSQVSINIDTSGNITTTGITSPTLYLNGVSCATCTLTLNQWSHVALTTGSAITGSAIILGNYSTTFYTGFMDDLRMDTTVKTASQIQADFASRGSVKGASAQEGRASTNYLNNGLVAYWKMDETSGTSASDSSGNSITGTLNNMQESGTSNNSGGDAHNLIDTTSTSLSTTNNVYNSMYLTITTLCHVSNRVGDQLPISAYNGTTKTITVPNGGFNATLNNCAYQIRHNISAKFGNGLAFDGINDAVSFTSTNVINPSQGSVALWFKPSGSQAAGSYIFAGRQSANNDRVYIKFVNAGLAVECDLSDGTQIGILTVTSATWNHAVCTWNGTKAAFYVNGQDVTTTSTIPAMDNNVAATSYIGGFDTSGSQNFFGIIDDVRVYNRALNVDEIKNLFSWAPGPIAYWKFEENTGTTANDSSGNGNTGTLTGSTNNRWASGMVGSAGSFGGPTPNDLVTTSNGNSIKATMALTISMWVFPTAYNSLGGELYFEPTTTAAGSSTRFEVLMNLSGTVDIDGRATGVDGGADTTWVTSTATAPLNQWSHIAATLTTTTQTICVNGNCVSASNSLDGFPDANPAFVPDIAGESDGSANDFTGKIDEVKIYNYARTTQQIVEDMNSGHPAGGSPVGTQMIYYKFDEGYGTLANNSVFNQSGYSGTINGTTWKVGASCKINNCLNFGTSTDNVSEGNPNFLDLGLTGLSVAFWVNPNTLATSKSIVARSNFSSTSQFAITTDSSTASEIRVYIASSTSDTGSNYFLTSGLGLANGSWSHIVVIYDGTQTATNRIKVYKNGILVSGSYTGTIPTSLVTGSTAALRVGSSQSASFTALNAILDDVQIYQGVVSQEQARVIYNANSSVNYGTTQLESALLTNGTGNAPLGFWNFEEGQSGTANDISGNGNTGTWHGTGAHWTAGKIGFAGKFNGTDDKVSTSNGNSVKGLTQVTFEAWIYPTAYNANDACIYCEGTASNADLSRFDMELLHTGFVTMNGRGGTTGDSGSFTTYATSATTAPLNQWSFVAEVFDASTDVHTMYINGVAASSSVAATGFTNSNPAGVPYIGSSSAGTDTNDFTGKIDQVKIYNYARTVDQIQYDYNRGAPFAWWKMDDCTGTTLHDSSGNGNSATLSVGATGTYTSAGACNDGNSAHSWNAGSSGKINSAIALDGTNDQITTTNNNSIKGLSQVTISAWIYPTAYDASNSDIYYEQVSTAASTNTRLSLQLTSTGTIQLGGRGTDAGSFTVFAVTSAVVPLNQWSLITGVYNADTDVHKIYINGIQSVSTSTSTTAFDNTTPNAVPQIGSEPAGDTWDFTGLIDDVRLYNYALTASQIKQIKDNGAAVFYGPSTGTPAP